MPRKRAHSPESTPAKKRPAKPKPKSKEVKGRQMEKERERDAVDGLERDIDWTTDLTWSLVTAVTDTMAIRDALFPGPGANRSSSKGGGKTKTESHATLAELLFLEHDTYGVAYRADQVEKKDRVKWATKIKNRLDKICREVREHMQSMEQTGNGIESADDIDFSRDNQFTNLAEKVLAECPWYFPVRNLIAQRPNLQPVGLGNNQSRVDESVLQSGLYISDSDHEDDVCSNSQALPTADDSDPGLDHEDTVSDKKPEPSRSTARPKTESTKPKARSSVAKLRPEDRLVAMNADDERTRQIALEARIADTSVEKARIQADLEKKRMRAAYKLEKLRYKTQKAAMKNGVYHHSSFESSSTRARSPPFTALTSYRSANAHSFEPTTPSTSVRAQSPPVRAQSPPTQTFSSTSPFPSTSSFISTHTSSAQPFALMPSFPSTSSFVSVHTQSFEPTAELSSAPSTSSLSLTNSH